MNNRLNILILKEYVNLLGSKLPAAAAFVTVKKATGDISAESTGRQTGYKS